MEVFLELLAYQYINANKECELIQTILMHKVQLYVLYTSVLLPDHIDIT